MLWLSSLRDLLLQTPSHLCIRQSVFLPIAIDVFSKLIRELAVFLTVISYVS
jgi:hypothetical protein